jgi:hypothetical protein
MIVYKQWLKSNEAGTAMDRCDGWFLFGFIPLYVRMFR